MNFLKQASRVGCRTHLSPLFNLLLLSVPLLHVPHEQALTEELLRSARGLNVQKRIVSVFDHALPEGTNAKLNHGSVVENLKERERDKKVIPELVFSTRARLPPSLPGCLPTWTGGSA